MYAKTSDRVPSISIRHPCIAEHPQTKLFPAPSAEPTTMKSNEDKQVRRRDRVWRDEKKRCGHRVYTGRKRSKPNWKSQTTHDYERGLRSWAPHAYIQRNRKVNIKVKRHKNVEQTVTNIPNVSFSTIGLSRKEPATKKIWQTRTLIAEHWRRREVFHNRTHATSPHPWSCQTFDFIITISCFILFQIIWLISFSSLISLLAIQRYGILASK